MPVDSGRIDIIDLGDFSPAKGRVLEIGPDYDGTLGNLEMAMNQMDSMDLVGIVADK